MYSGMIALALLATAGTDGAAADYARPELLIEPRTLAMLSRETLALDARPRAQYLKGHLPRAVWVDTAAWTKEFARQKDAAAWSQRLAKLGVRANVPIVVYDDGSVMSAARVWWILRYWGVKNVQLLNGGWPAWHAADLGAEKEPTLPRPSDFKAQAVAGRLATRARVQALLKDDKAQLIDTRSEGEHCGTAKLAKHGGAIPGSRHLEWSEVLDPKTRRFRSAAELTKLFAKAHIDPRRPVVTYCQSGGRAAVMAFTLELMGGRDVANYYRGWSEWGNADDTPIERSKK